MFRSSNNSDQDISIATGLEAIAITLEAIAIRFLCLFIEFTNCVANCSDTTKGLTKCEGGAGTLWGGFSL